MPGIDFSTPLLGAGAQAKNEWASASARTSLTFTGAAQFRRGINVEIGVEALATADAAFQQFLAASIRGNAFAKAHAKLQLQLPLNLFAEAGLAVGAEAAAQAAAGLEAGLGLSVGDFVQLAKADPASAGLPLYLLLILLEEVSLGGKFEVHVAAAAMAYASLKITGSVIDRPGRPAGVAYVVEAGLGAAAGVGFSGGLNLGFENFRRFYGRAVDATVDATIGAIRDLLPESPAALRQGLFAFAPVAKISLRVAYEIGQHIENEKPRHSARDAANLANHCVGIVLEEAQRFLFDLYARAGITELRTLLGVAAASRTAWKASAAERAALADILARMPAEPFAVADSNVKYWRNLVAAAVDLVAKMANADLLRPVTCIFAAADLLLETMRTKVEDASSYALAVGAGRVEAKPPFSNQLDRPPPRAIREHINKTLGRAPTQSIGRVDLVRYLAHATGIAMLRRVIPDLDAFLRVFQGPIAASEEAVCRVLLMNRAAFVPGPNGADPRATLRALLFALDAFVTGTVKTQLAPAIATHLPRPEQRQYFDEVLLPTVCFVKDVAFDTVLHWDTRPIDKAAFTEALGSVLMMLLGRTLVITGDAFMTAIQLEMKRACAHAARNLESTKSPFAAMGITPDAATLDLFRTALDVAGEVFGPLPTASRRRLRNVLYQVFETLPPNSQADFLADLGDQFFIPNRADLDEVGRELLAISCERFGRLVQLLFDKLGGLVLDALQRLIDDLVAQLQKWEKELERTIAQLFAWVQRLDRELQAAIAAAQDAFDAVTKRVKDAVDALADDRLRNRLKDKILDRFEEDALDLLRDNPVYKNLPLGEVKKLARSGLKTAVRGLVGPAIVNPVLEVIGGIARELASITGRLDALNPRRPLGPQILDLVLGELDDRLNALTPPSINLGFSIHFDFLGPKSVSFSLGRISLPRARWKDIARTSIATLDFYAAQLASAADAAKAWFDAVADEVKARAKHAALSADHQRLATISAEHTATAKAIRIVSPTDQARVSTGATAVIELVGTPRSYLGLERDAQPRVIVLLNGTQVPLANSGVATSANPRVPGITVSLALPAAALARGLNVLTVVLLDRGSRVLRQQARFSYAPTPNLVGPVPPIRSVPVVRQIGGGQPARAPVPLADVPVGLAAVRGNVSAAGKTLRAAARAKTTGLGSIVPGGRP